MQNKQRTKSVPWIILSAMLVVLITEVFLMVGSILFSGVNQRLDDNAIDILEKQVENRKSYLENEMVENWSNLSLLSKEINAATERLRKSGEIDMSTLDSSSASCLPLLKEISGNMISTLYSKQVTGIFVVFNTKNLEEENGYFTRPGLYIRDMDPQSTPSVQRSDLLLERAPVELSKFLDIPTDSQWRPMFYFPDNEESGMLHVPFQTVLKEKKREEAEEYGYWTTTSYTLEGDSLPAISYSMPLILDDGTVYGVLGVEMLTRYLQSLLPYNELHDNSQGNYLLGSLSGQAYGEEHLNLNVNVSSSGPFFPSSAEGKSFYMHKRGDGYILKDGKEQYYAAVHPLSLYSRNGHFADEQWMLVGTVRTKALFAFSGQVFAVMMLALLAMCITGMIGSILASKKVSQPIIRLSEEVMAHQGKTELPALSYTGVEELDRFASAITELSREVLESSTKFLRIMDMASVELGGYEYREDTGAVFVTDNFFELLGIKNVEKETLTPNKLLNLLHDFHENHVYTEDMEGNRVYQIPVGDGRIRYMRMEVTKEGNRQFGLAEDVTSVTLEKLRIEHERDYDSLTGLYSRRAFKRKSEELFLHPKQLKYAALLMLDLDNLKKVNDTHGHDWGDHYIRQAGRCIIEHVPVGTLCARISGDEFFVMFYGYDKKESIRKALDYLYRAIRDTILILPSGKELHISASGGVAWYPEDSGELSMLMKYADFAMYQIKKSHKGEMKEFDIGSYNEMAYHSQTRKEFYQLIEKELLNYHFQPIVSAADGTIFAYEALMRADLPTLHTPDAVMRIAREESRLHDIERLTLFKAPEAFCRLAERGEIDGDALLFINSIASQHMTDEESEEFRRRFSHVQKQIVVEITEEELMDGGAVEKKRNTPGFSGMFALDDYGSGYNTEKNLLELSPKFIKVDISIVRDIDTDVDKQQILANIVSYAHQRDMKIIAEGLETASETLKALEMGVDLFQGYYLARPAAVPGPVSPDAISLISDFHWKKNMELK